MKSYQLPLILALLLIGSVFSVRQDVDEKSTGPTETDATPEVQETAPIKKEESDAEATEPSIQTLSPVTNKPPQSIDSEDVSGAKAHPTIGATSAQQKPLRRKQTQHKLVKRHNFDDDEDIQRLIAKPHKNIKSESHYESHSDVTRIVNGKGTRVIKSNVDGKRTKKVIQIGANKKPVNPKRKPKPKPVGHQSIDTFD